jgi:hypothetical protein
MTYNFDPERWFENEHAALDARRTKGGLSDVEYQEELEKLLVEYEKMLDRLKIQYDYSKS